jgi:hypothetical protein
MNKALPPGMISLDEAVELIARHEHPKLTIIYRDAAFSAWDKLCKIAPIAARILTGDGLLRKPGAAQFDGFVGKYWKFASTPIQYPPHDDTRVPRELELNPFPSYDLLDEHGVTHHDARLVFLESEIDAALGSSGKGKVATRKRGRKPMLDWKDVEHEVERLMNDNGEFMPCYPQWNCLAQLEKAIADFISEKFDTIPAESTIREHISPALEKWREDKVKAGN